MFLHVNGQGNTAGCVSVKIENQSDLSPTAPAKAAPVTVTLPRVPPMAILVTRPPSSPSSGAAC